MNENLGFFLTCERYYIIFSYVTNIADKFLTIEKNFLFFCNLISYNESIGVRLESSCLRNMTGSYIIVISSLDHGFYGNSLTVHSYLLSGHPLY